MIRHFLITILFLLKLDLTYGRSESGTNVIEQKCYRPEFYENFALEHRPEEDQQLFREMQEAECVVFEEFSKRIPPPNAKFQSSDTKLKKDERDKESNESDGKEKGLQGLRSASSEIYHNPEKAHMVKRAKWMVKMYKKLATTESDLYIVANNLYSEMLEIKQFGWVSVQEFRQNCRELMREMTSLVPDSELDRPFEPFPDTWTFFKTGAKLFLGLFRGGEQNYEEHYRFLKSMAEDDNLYKHLELEEKRVSSQRRRRAKRSIYTLGVLFLMFGGIAGSLILCVYICGKLRKGSGGS